MKANGQLTDGSPFVTPALPSGVAEPSFGAASCSPISSVPRDARPEVAIVAAVA
jgi:hypothetical protein